MLKIQDTNHKNKTLCLNPNEISEIVQDGDALMIHMRNGHLYHVKGDLDKFLDGMEKSKAVQFEMQQSYLGDLSDAAFNKIVEAVKKS